MGLSLFPVRAPIGRVTGADGREFDVLMTPEFSRALSDLLVRVGGETALSNNDLAVLESFGDPLASVADLALQIADLRQQMELLQQPLALPVTSYGQDFEVNYSFVPPAVDWEHPGSIGAQTPNIGSFTVVKIAAGTVLLPTLYFSTDTTTGLYRPGANSLAITVSAVNIVTWSAAGALYKQNVSTEKQFISTLAIGTPPLIVTSTTMVPNLYVARAALADNATVLTSPTAFPANATDLPTVINLANALKAAGIAKGL